MRPSNVPTWVEAAYTSSWRPPMLATEAAYTHSSPKLQMYGAAHVWCVARSHSSKIWCDDSFQFPRYFLWKCRQHAILNNFLPHSFLHFFFYYSCQIIYYLALALVQKLRKTTQGSILATSPQTSVALCDRSRRIDVSYELKALKRTRMNQPPEPMLVQV